MRYQGHIADNMGSQVRDANGDLHFVPETVRGDIRWGRHQPVIMELTQTGLDGYSGEVTALSLNLGLIAQTHVTGTVRSLSPDERSGVLEILDTQMGVYFDQMDKSEYPLILGVRAEFDISFGEEGLLAANAQTRAGSIPGSLHIITERVALIDDGGGDSIFAEPGAIVGLEKPKYGHLVHYDPIVSIDRSKRPRRSAPYATVDLYQNTDFYAVATGSTGPGSRLRDIVDGTVFSAIQLLPHGTIVTYHLYDGHQIDIRPVAQLPFHTNRGLVSRFDGDQGYVMDERTGYSYFFRNEDILWLLPDGKRTGNVQVGRRADFAVPFPQKSRAGRLSVDEEMHPSFAPGRPGRIRTLEKGRRTGVVSLESGDAYFTGYSLPAGFDTGQLHEGLEVVVDLLMMAGRHRVVNLGVISAFGKRYSI
ncbi:MAG: hypothetical protein ABH879_00320 [archaeon]